MDNIYGTVEDSICICLRLGYDHPGRYELDREYYIEAIELYKKMGIDTSNLFILSDVPGVWESVFHLQEDYPAIEINEPDVIQFYFGLECSHYILSASTFHLWIAYLGGSDKLVIYKPVDVLKTLALSEWISL